MSKEKALEWIVSLLNSQSIPFSICGGLAANFYGSERPLNDIDLFVPEEHFYALVNAGSDFISKPAQHYCEASEGWNLEYVQFIYAGIKIEVGSSGNIKIFDKMAACWKPLLVDFENTTKGDILGVHVSVMTKPDLINYKTLLSRAVDEQDILSIK